MVEEEFQFTSGVERARAHIQALPILNVWSEGDHGQRPAWSERFERQFPNRRTVIISGAKHFPPGGQPDAVIAAIRDWWESEVREKPAAVVEPAI